MMSNAAECDPRHGASLAHCPDCDLWLRPEQSCLHMVVRGAPVSRAPDGAPLHFIPVPSFPAREPGDVFEPPSASPGIHQDPLHQHTDAQRTVGSVVLSHTPENSHA